MSGNSHGAGSADDTSRRGADAISYMAAISCAKTDSSGNSHWACSGRWVETSGSDHHEAPMRQSVRTERYWARVANGTRNVEADTICCSAAGNADETRQAWQLALGSISRMAHATPKRTPSDSAASMPTWRDKSGNLHWARLVGCHTHVEADTIGYCAAVNADEKR